ncbi:hypothetical protein [Kamptonema sp. UHCC 0994]|uniref:hypothetical protein n=1 Tax=Kamptonema sp. UHCC 0994 TaxID=3031329 RepID=UPI0023B9AE56|nr:hypothetical protein [Kamptonema sp. UHCC 0994]MDF0553467.1 hypothetical protein [Kamptonema sp. UHCC 0994]
MGTLNIAASSVVYVDTSIIIYTVEKFPEYLPLLESMWVSFHTGEIESEVLAS